MGSRWWQTAVACVLSALAAIGIYITVSGEPEPDAEPGPEPTPVVSAPAKLMLARDDVAAWIAFNNSFEKAFKDTTVNGKWSGLLFQLGTFYGPGYKYASIELFKDGQSVAQLDPGMNLFYWVNVIAEDKERPDPIDPANAFYLFPSRAPSDSCPITTDRCDRNRKIHGSEDVVSSLITYWHGANGYDIAADPLIEEGKLANKYEFALNDPIRVQVRHFDVTAEALGWTLDHDLEAGAVDSIVVREGPKPPDMGAKQEPAWPFP